MCWIFQLFASFSDFPDLVPLMTDAFAVMDFDEVIADTGYDREANHRFCRETLGVHSLIPAKRRRSIKFIVTIPYRQEMHRLLNDSWDAASKRAYRQRRKIETVKYDHRRGSGGSYRLGRDMMLEILLSTASLVALIVIAAEVW